MLLDFATLTSAFHDLKIFIAVRVFDADEHGSLPHHRFYHEIERRSSEIGIFSIVLKLFYLQSLYILALQKRVFPDRDLKIPCKFEGFRIPSSAKVSKMGLVYLGIKTIVSKATAPAGDSSPPPSLSQLFRKGSSCLTRKQPCFSMPFSRSLLTPPVDLLLLGVLFVLLATIADSIYALISSSVGRMLTGRVAFQRIQKYVTGGIYISLGVAAAVSGSGKSSPQSRFRSSFDFHVFTEGRRQTRLSCDRNLRKRWHMRIAWSLIWGRFLMACGQPDYAE
jgi:hypothetical protein